MINTIFNFEAGDPIAKRVFKEEIAKRYASRFPSVVRYLEHEGYLKYLSKDELSAIYINYSVKFLNTVLYLYVK